MARSFDPSREIAESKKFRTLAALFQKHETNGLRERFSNLAALSEAKAQILMELDEAAILSDAEAPEAPIEELGNVIEWPDNLNSAIKKRSDN
jgi:hypothetical protein